MIDLKFHRFIKNCSNNTPQKYKELLKINDGCTNKSNNKNVKNESIDIKYQLKYMETFYRSYCINHINYFNK